MLFLEVHPSKRLPLKILYTKVLNNLLIVTKPLGTFRLLLLLLLFLLKYADVVVADVAAADAVAVDADVAADVAAATALSGAITTFHLSYCTPP